MAAEPNSEIVLPKSLADDSLYFCLDQIDDAISYYGEEGYVVLRGLIAAEQCDRVRTAFDQSVRRTRTPILRQKNMRYEHNHFTADGFLDNPIFNVQDLNSKTFRDFKSAALDVLTDAHVAAATEAILGGPVKLVQSMFFEAAANTWAHQDSYYQDSSSGLGRMTAGWFALEDIDAGAGRFFVCPRSHRELTLIKNDGANNFASGHETYKESMAAAIRAARCRVVAPYMAKGDVLFWTSLTAHGSLEGTRRGVSRASLTAHYLKADDEMLQFHTRIRRQATEPCNAMQIGHLHDQNSLVNRAVSQVSFAFPDSVEQLRKAAMWALIRGKSLAGPGRNA